MSLKLTVKHKDGSESRTTITASTEVAFEEHFGKAWGEAFSEDPILEVPTCTSPHGIRSTTTAAQRLDFKPWLRTMDSFEVEVPEESDPLDQEAPPG
jgi:hypothetical protein